MFVHQPDYEIGDEIMSIKEALAKLHLLLEKCERARASVQPVCLSNSEGRALEVAVKLMEEIVKTADSLIPDAKRCSSE